MIWWVLHVLDYKWQAQQQTGCDVGQFQIDWQAKHATCPEGCMRRRWTPAIDNRKNEVIKLKFSTKDGSMLPRPRMVYAIGASASHHHGTAEQPDQARQHACERAKTDDVKTLDARRAGVEETISQGVLVLGLPRSRSIGHEQTHLPHLATAAAMHVVRIGRWLDGKPLVQLLRPVVEKEIRGFACSITIQGEPTGTAHQVATTGRGDHTP